MAADKSSSVSFSPPLSTGRHASPPPQQLRQRPLTRASTLGDVTIPLNRRRSSIFSENLSDTKRSLRDSTDDLLFPQASSTRALQNVPDPSHWQSAPLALALLPAVGGLLFQNGNAFLTDATILILAAVFLNWSIRLPWAWYHSAQSVRTSDPYSPPTFDVIEEEGSEDMETPEEAAAPSQEITTPSRMKNTPAKTTDDDDPAVVAAEKELHLHELLALLSCFVAPVLAAWLLHAIRAQLSRPSEGLISNYNLTIFLLATEMKPLSHLVKMIQARTLFLQKIVDETSPPEPPRIEDESFQDVIARLEEIERHVANAAEDSGKAVQVAPEATPELLTAKLTAQVTSEMRKGIQPELDALNRAVRRYEKRTTISAIQTEARLQELESRLRDAVVLAAAAQRNVSSQPRNFIVILVNWLCGVVVIPVQYGLYLLNLPARVFQSVYNLALGKLSFRRRRPAKDTRSVRHVPPKPRDRKGRAVA